MNVKKRGLEIIKKVAINNANVAMKSACIGFCYQPISPKKKQVKQKND